MECTKQKDDPDDDLECGLVPRYRDPLGVHMIPERPRFRSFVRYIIDIFIVIVHLNQISFPECVDHILSFGRGQEGLPVNTG